jgi:hypothetical protein
MGLRDCPQCDADAAFLVGDAVECQACGLRGPAGREPAEAAVKWNGPTAEVIGFPARRPTNGKDEDAAQAAEAPDSQAGRGPLAAQGTQRSDGRDAQQEAQVGPAAGVNQNTASNPVEREGVK